MAFIALRLPSPFWASNSRCVNRHHMHQQPPAAPRGPKSSSKSVHLSGVSLWNCQECSCNWSRLIVFAPFSKRTRRRGRTASCPTILLQNPMRRSRTGLFRNTRFRSVLAASVWLGLTHESAFTLQETLGFSWRTTSGPTL
jgi:hypothetical protein